MNTPYPTLNFNLGEEIDMLRDMVYQFCQAELAPRAEQIDLDNEFPADIWRKFGNLGLLGEYSGVDAGDLYFQNTSHEAWSLEDGLVRSGTHAVEQGVGIRVVVGDQTGYAYSEDLAPEALKRAARTAAAIDSEPPLVRTTSPAGQPDNAATCSRARSTPVASSASTAHIS